MTTVGEQIRSADEVICRNIDSLSDQRDLLSQNILAQIRNLVEGVALLLQSGQIDADFSYAAVPSALAFVKAKPQLDFLSKFHKLMQASTSHYTLDGDASERLMLKYYEYLLRIRRLLRDHGLAVLANLEAFPVDLDPSLREYHEKIAQRIEAVRVRPSDGDLRGRYYIHKVRPFFVGGRIYYEVTFHRASNQVSKFERIIGFTDIDVADYYAAMLTLRSDAIEVLGHTMPITIIRDWQISIRPCEFNNLARLFGLVTRVDSGSSEFRYLMGELTAVAGSLLDLIDLPDDAYARVRAASTARVSRPQIFPTLDAARNLIRRQAPGHNLIRYLMLRMRNQLVKAQYNREPCDRLSGLRLKWGCIPFDTMPFCSSPVRHNPPYWDLAESLDPAGRTHELLARRVKNNVNNHGRLYTPVAELADLGDLDTLLSTYNRKLYSGHRRRRLELDMDHVFIREYEEDIAEIVEQLQQFAALGIGGYTSAVERWLATEAPFLIDDAAKENALKRLFSQSRVALIYGAAGTGKSTMVNHIANYFNDKRKLFLAHTHPAVDNLTRKVDAQNATFRTIRSHLHHKGFDPEYDLLVIDECSTVSNADLIAVLQRTSFKQLVLVGDVYQIEAIQFGNWFGIIRSFLPSTAVFELTTPYRTKNPALLGFWNKVRHISDDITEVIARNGYSTVLDESLLAAQHGDEIILCLNYDGLYGINNINRFLQSSNPGVATTWGITTYKVGDPVLFNEIERFKPLIYNNLKGRIVGIERFTDQIQFDVELAQTPGPSNAYVPELEWLDDATVRFSVFERDTSDEDDDSLNTTVPFQVAYAVSIHKAQGLEYDSVKIVITDANEGNVTHSIFYTAVTRARERLRIFWTPETQQAVLAGLQRSTNPKDVALLSKRRGLTPIS